MQRLLHSSRFHLAGAMAVVILLLAVQIAQAHTHPALHAHEGTVHGGEVLLLLVGTGISGMLWTARRRRDRR